MDLLPHWITIEICSPGTRWCSKVKRITCQHWLYGEQRTTPCEFLVVDSKIMILFWFPVLHNWYRNTLLFLSNRLQLFFPSLIFSNVLHLPSFSSEQFIHSNSLSSRIGRNDILNNLLSIRICIVWPEGERKQKRKTEKTAGESPDLEIHIWN